MGESNHERPEDMPTDAIIAELENIAYRAGMRKGIEIGTSITFVAFGALVMVVLVVLGYL